MKTLFVIFIFLIQFSLVTLAQEKMMNSQTKEIIAEDKSLDEFISALKYRKDSIMQESLKKPYPDFIAMPLDGNVITEKDLFGKVTIINFWFSSCPPCIAEFDALGNLYEKWKDNLEFQFISFCTDPVEQAKESAQKHQLPYPVCPIEGEQFSTLLLWGFPVNLIVNREGKIIHYKSGGHTEKEKVDKEIQDIEQKIKNELNK